MSRAFMKEGDDQWLSDIAPTMSALLVYLTKENNDIRVVEEKQIIDKKGREVYFMSNGLAYVKDDDGRWSVAEESE
jgi:ribosomal protein S8